MRQIYMYYKRLKQYIQKASATTTNGATTSGQQKARVASEPP